MLYPDLKAAFLHIPKTGGKSVKLALEPWEKPDRSLPYHPSATELVSPPDWLRFTVVRNPWDRLISYFHYGMRKQKPAPAWTFEEFVRWAVGRKPLTDEYAPGWNDMQRTMSGILLVDGVLAVDAVLRFETLSQDWLLLQRRLGIDAPLPHINASRGDHYRSRLDIRDEHYSRELRLLVRAKWKADFELFHYDFFGP